jgi:Tol biopolymer transport system component/DNA-binding winged helix-turn-helix (wHTH) protein
MNLRFPNVPLRQWANWAGKAMQCRTPVAHALITRQLVKGVALTFGHGLQVVNSLPNGSSKVLMTQPALSPAVIRFEAFEVSLQAAELRKRGRRVKLQEQPFRVLAMLLERPGEMVTREEMRQKLWPADTFVDFDHGLNSAVARLREALNDSAENPRFIETVPRRGYRFIAHADLPALADPSPEVAKMSSPKLSPRKFWTALGAALLIALSGIGIWRLVEKRLELSLPSVEVVPLAGMPGYEVEPAFSPNGNQVAFLELDGQNSGIYTALVGGERSLRLTGHPNDCCAAWSPDGLQVAFARLFENEVGIYVIPALGGTERRLYTEPRPLYPSLAWSPDGKVLAFPESRPHRGHSWITFLSLTDSTTRQLTFPPDDARDNCAAFSPDGSMVAFTRGTLAGVVNDVFVVPAAGGEAKRVTFDNRPMFGISWTADGHEIVFSSMRGGQTSLWRVPASGGTPRPVAGASSEALSPAVAPQGNLLAYQQAISKDNIWRLNLTDEKHPQGPPTVVISAKGSKLRPHFSPDGRKIAFESDRLGNAEIWTCDSDGGNCAQLTSQHGTAGTVGWAPDGLHIAFEFHPKERAEIYVVEVPGGIPQLVSTIPGADNLVPSWSRDGKWIYFTSQQGDGPFQLWKVPWKGGSPIQITRTGGLNAVESADGRFLYYSKYETGGVWRMPLNGGQESRVLDQPSGRAWYNWGLTPSGIYFLHPEDFSLDSRSGSDFLNHVEPLKTMVDFFEFASHKTTHISTLDKPTGWGLAVAPDGRSLLYVETEFEESSIMLLKNFR